MKILNVMRGICLTPIIMIYGAWMLFKFTLGLIVLVLATWLIHTLFGIAGDVMLALPIIYVLSYLLPNPRLGNIGNKLMNKLKSSHQSASVPKADVVDINAYKRGAKQ